MAEVRRDPVSGRWVIIATGRAARPRDFHVPRGKPRDGFCPFCEGNEDRTPPEITAVRPLGSPPNTPGWKVRVVPNKFPALRDEGLLETQRVGVYESVSGFGAHEVIIESAQHLASPTAMARRDFELVLQTYGERSRALAADKRLAYVLIFKNVGEAAGASLEHSHSQLIGLPVMPKRVQEEMQSCHEYRAAHGRCLFCQILDQELKDGERVVAQSDGFAVLSPFAARFPFEMWVLPKDHSWHVSELDGGRTADLAGLLQEALGRLEVCLNDPPYNYIIHTAPVAGPEADHYHWHIEVIPRVTHVAGFEWGTGFYINPMEPERAAAYLRDVPESKLREKTAAMCACREADK